MKRDVPVVSNAGPLMVLAKLNLLHLLVKLYGYVYVPRSVYDEVATEGIKEGYQDAITFSLFMEQVGWQPEEVDASAISAELQEVHLDRGERDTLALAIILGNALVLMDETAGRRIARTHGLAVHGSLGILVQAYRQELIGADELRFYLTEIEQRQDIWISQKLIQRGLKEILGDQPENK